MKLKAFSIATAALSLVIAPTVSVAATVQTPLTQPATEVVEGDSALVGGGAAFFILLLSVGSIAAGVTAGVSNTTDAPNSP